MKRSNVFLLILLCIVVGLVSSSCTREDFYPLDPIVDPTVVVKCAVEATSGLGGIITPSGVITVNKGSSITFAISSDLGFKADSISIDGVSSPLISDTYSITNIIKDTTIVEVSFRKVEVETFSVEVIAGTGGAVTPSGIISVIKGASLSLNITADFGHEADFVVVNGVSHPLTSSTYALNNITSNLKIEVMFKKTYIWYLIQGSFKELSCEARTVNTTGDWISFPVDSRKYFFDDHGRFKLFSEGGTLVGDGPYILEEDSLIIGPDPNGNGGIRNKIIILNGDSMVLRSVGLYYGPNGYDPSKNMDEIRKYKHL